jgi:hypothetical protein
MSKINRVTGHQLTGNVPILDAEGRSELYDGESPEHSSDEEQQTKKETKRPTNLVKTLINEAAPEADQQPTPGPATTQPFQAADEYNPEAPLLNNTILQQRSTRISRQKAERDATQPYQHDPYLLDRIFGDPSYTAKKCRQCTRYRRCHRHRNQFQNTTSVSLCPHVRMYLYWDENDPINARSSWRLQIQDSFEGSESRYVRTRADERNRKIREEHKSCRVYAANRRTRLLAERVCEDIEVTRKDLEKRNRKEWDRERKEENERIVMRLRGNVRRVANEIAILLAAWEREWAGQMRRKEMERRREERKAEIERRERAEALEALKKSIADVEAMKMAEAGRKRKAEGGEDKGSPWKKSKLDGTSSPSAVSAPMVGEADDAPSVEEAVGTLEDIVTQETATEDAATKHAAAEDADSTEDAAPGDADAIEETTTEEATGTQEEPAVIQEESSSSEGSPTSAKGSPLKEGSSSEDDAAPEEDSILEESAAQEDPVVIQEGIVVTQEETVDAVDTPEKTANTKDGASEETPATPVENSSPKGNLSTPKENTTSEETPAAPEESTTSKASPNTPKESSTLEAYPAASEENVSSDESTSSKESHSSEGGASLEKGPSAGNAPASPEETTAINEASSSPKIETTVSHELPQFLSGSRSPSPESPIREPPPTNLEERFGSATEDEILAAMGMSPPPQSPSSSSPTAHSTPALQSTAPTTQSPTPSRDVASSPKRKRSNSSDSSNAGSGASGGSDSPVPAKKSKKVHWTPEVDTSLQSERPSILTAKYTRVRANGSPVDTAFGDEEEGELSEDEEGEVSENSEEDDEEDEEDEESKALRQALKSALKNDEPMEDEPLVLVENGDVQTVLMESSDAQAERERQRSLEDQLSWGDNSDAGHEIEERYELMDADELSDDEAWGSEDDVEKREEEEDYDV